MCIAANIFFTFLFQPFLDPKVVAERIIEVIKNFEKVNISCPNLEELYLPLTLSL